MVFPASIVVTHGRWYLVTMSELFERFIHIYETVTIYRVGLAFNNCVICLISPLSQDTKVLRETASIPLYHWSIFCFDHVS